MLRQKPVWSGESFDRWDGEALRGFVKTGSLVKVSSNCCAKGSDFFCLDGGEADSVLLGVSILSD